MENQKTLLSVVVPCCNVEKYINHCLDSIRNQSYSNFEVICVNDGSSDNTLFHLQAYSAKDPRFKVLDKKNTGYGDSMNRGLALAQGKYVAIIESDDFVESSMFEDLVSIAEKYELDIARGGYYYYCDGTDQPEQCSYVPKNVILKPIDCPSIFYQPPAIWASIYRRSFLEKNEINFLPTPGASFQDTSFAFKAYYFCSRFMMLPQCYVHYRQHSNNSVRSNGKVFCVCDEWNEIFRIATLDQSSFQKLKVSLFELYNNTYRWNYSRLLDEPRELFVKRWGDDIRKFEKFGVRPFPSLSKKRKVEFYVLKYFPYMYVKLRNLVKVLF